MREFKFEGKKVLTVGSIFKANEEIKLNENTDKKIRDISPNEKVIVTWIEPKEKDPLVELKPEQPIWKGPGSQTYFTRFSSLMKSGKYSEEV